MYKIGYANIILAMFVDVTKKIFLKIGLKQIRFNINLGILTYGINKDKIKA
jgi:hypothetical protein